MAKTLDDYRTPLRTDDIRAIISDKIEHLGWPRHIYRFTALPCAIEAIGQGGDATPSPSKVRYVKAQSESASRRSGCERHRRTRYCSAAKEKTPQALKAIGANRPRSLACGRL